MDETPSQPEQDLLQTASQRKGDRGVYIAAIIGLVIVVLACIAAATIVMVAFINTAPW